MKTYSAPVSNNANWAEESGNWTFNGGIYSQTDISSGDAKLVLGENGWCGYSIEALVNPIAFGEGGAVNLFAYGEYKASLTESGVKLFKGGGLVGLSSEALEAGVPVLAAVSVAELQSGAEITVSINGQNVINYAVPSALAEGAAGIGTSYAECEFSEIKLNFLMKHGDYIAVMAVDGVVAALETAAADGSFKLEDAEAVLSAVNGLTLNGAVRSLLLDRFERTLASFTKLEAAVNTKTRLISVSGVYYFKRGENIEIIVEKDGYKKEAAVSADSLGIFGTEFDIGENAETGTYKVYIKEEPDIFTFVNYRKAAAENDIFTFYVNGANGTVSGGRISVQLSSPAQTASLIPEFTLSGYAEAYVGGALQQSGVTKNDFTSPVIYEIRAENGETKEYTVTVTPYSPRTPAGGGGGGRPSSVGGGGIPVAVNQNPPAYNEAENVSVEEIFTDLDNAEWAKPYIAECYRLGIVSGGGNGAFEPLRDVTRSEFVKMLVSAFNIPRSNGIVDFEDVLPSDWCYPYIRDAVAAGVVNGYGNGFFGSNDYITRQDISVMVYRLAKDRLEYKEPAVFSDGGGIASYARESVKKLAEAGIIRGNDGVFRPADNATRAEAAKIIASVLINNA
jgi:hypothetical protein